MIKMQGLIFDLDGTLIDSSGDIASALNVTLKQLGLPEKSLLEVQSIVGDGVRILMGRAIGKKDDLLLEKAIKIFKEYYLHHCVDNTALYPGVKEILKKYKEKKLGVVSNKPYPMVIKTLQHFSLENVFTVVLGAESTEQKKPHPQPFLEAIKKMSVPPSHTLVIGDGTTDMEGGHAAGMKTCAVTYGYRSKKELEKFKPDFFIDKLEDLEKIIV